MNQLGFDYAVSNPPLLPIHLRKTATERASGLETRFDPESCQWEQDGTVYRLAELSHVDLVQVACESIEVMERVGHLHHQLGNLIETWRNGRITPEQLEPAVVGR